MAGSNPSFAQRFIMLLETQATANFAMVMSTGIVSIALHLLGYQKAASLLFLLNILLFCLLITLYLLRFILFPERMKADFLSHTAGFGFLTIVAGTCILGNQFILLGGRIGYAEPLFWISLVLWCLILFGVFAGIMTQGVKPLVENGLNGAWLVATVSTQALVILGTLLSPHVGWNRDAAFLLFSILFFLGFMLYLFVIGVIFYRFCYKPLPPKALSPTYWINAGAVAITTLAGSELITHGANAPTLIVLMPFIRGLTLMAWATASFWIPVLFLLGFWRHAVVQYPFIYTAEYWGMVFPMGMYTACTVMLCKAFGTPFLMGLPEGFLYVACIAWLCTFVGMVYSRLKMLLALD